MSKKDIQFLIGLTRKCGEAICDAGTFEERNSQYLVMKWKYKGNEFVHKFPGLTKTTTVNYQYHQLRKNLRANGMGPPNEFSMDFKSSAEQQKLLEELWVYLGTDEEGQTPYGGEVDRG
jgi:hypothetical protein